MDAGNICRRLGKSREDFLLGLAFVFRLALICFGAWQDAHLEVPFTDIDYSVYTDAAMFMNARESPYKRSTYRYTPLLAGLLLPNCALSVYGKILFSIGDILAAQCVPNATPLCVCDACVYALCAVVSHVSVLICNM